MEAFVRAVEAPGASNRVLNVGSGRGITIEEAVGYVQTVFPSLRIDWANGSRDADYDSVADVALAREVPGWAPCDPRQQLPRVLDTEMVRKS